MTNRNKARDEKNEITQGTATHYKEPWDGGEDNYLLSSTTDPSIETATALGRTLRGVEHRRYKINARKIRTNAVWGGRNREQILSLQAAIIERKKALATGTAFVSIVSVPGGYVVREAHHGGY